MMMAARVKPVNVMGAVSMVIGQEEMFGFFITVNKGTVLPEGYGVVIGYDPGDNSKEYGIILLTVDGAVDFHQRRVPVNQSCTRLKALMEN